MTENFKPVTIIAGASAGTGTALGREFAQHVQALTLVARRKDQLEPFADEIAERTSVNRGLALCFLTKSPEYVAEAGYRGPMICHRTIVPGTRNWAITVMVRLVPRRLALWAIDRRQGRRWFRQAT